MHLRGHGWNTATSASPLQAGADVGRARRDIAFAGKGSSIRSIATRLGRAPSTVSRELKRNGGQMAYRATQADQAAWDQRADQRTVSSCNRAAAHGGRNAPDPLVARANSRLAQADLPARSEPSRVTRNHLSQSLYPGTWSPEKRAVGAPEANASHASLASPHPEAGQPRPDKGRHLDQRASGFCRRPGRTRALGRRSAIRQQEQSNRDFGGAQYALCDAR